MTNIAQTLNVYYTASQFNQSAGQVQALVDEKLLFPIIKDASQFQVGLVKSKVPLDTIPLTQSNIPLKTYEIILRKGNASGYAYLPQINSQTNSNYIWQSFGGTLTLSTYNSTGNLVLVDTIDVTQYIPFIYMFVIDDFSNIYAIGSNTQNGPNTLFYVFSNTVNPTVYVSNITYADLQCVCIDRNQRIYLASQSNGVEVFSNINSSTNVSLTLLKTITENFDAQRMLNIATVCSDQVTIIGYDKNYIQVFDTNYNPISSAIQLTNVVNLGNQSSILHDQDSFVLLDKGVIGDNLYGVQASPANTALNVDTAMQALQGEWLNVPAVNLDTTLALGVSIDNTVWITDNNSTAYPSQLNSSYSGTDLCSNLQNNWYVSNSVTGTLMCTDLNSSLSVFDTTFPTTMGDFDINKITGELIGVNTSTNLLVKSSAEVLPNRIWSLDPTAINPTIFQLTGCGIGTPQNILTMIGNNLQAGVSGNIIGFYPITSGFLAVQANYYTDATGDVSLYKCNSSYVLESSVTFTSGADLNGGTPVCCEYSKTFNIVCVADGLGDFFFIDVPSLTMITTATIMNTLGPVDNTQLFSISANVDGFLINRGTFLQYWRYDDVTKTNTFISTIDWLGVGFQRISAIFQNPQYPLSIILLGNLALGGLKLYYITFSTDYLTVNNIYGPWTNPATQNGTEVQITFPGSAVQSGISYFQGDHVGLKICVPTSNLNGIGYDIFLVNYIDYTLTFMTTLLIDSIPPSPWNPTTGECIPLFFQISDGISGYITYDTPITTNLGATIQSVAMSSQSNDIYVTDLSGKVYLGTLSGTSVTNFEQITTSGGQLYASISTWKDTNFSSDIKAYTISSQTPLGSQNLGLVEVFGLTRNEITGEFLTSTSDNNVIDYSYNLLSTNWTSSVPHAGCIFTKNSENIDAGPAPIYSYQVLINAINIAFELAFIRANVNGAGLLSAPVISMNFQTGICTLTYDSEYTNSKNGVVSSTDGILFNNALSTLIEFNSSADVLVSGFDLINLSIGSTSTSQNNQTITSFNELDKILFNSTTLFVGQSYFGNNQTNNTVTDIDYDSSTIISNAGQWLLYQPNFIRPFLLASNNAIDRIQIQIFYQYLNGTVYPLMINPSSGWNCKLTFIRKFGY